MSFASRARAVLTPFQRITTSRYLRRLLRAQEASAAALEQQNEILFALGRVLANATGLASTVERPWQPGDPEPDLDDDASEVTYADNNLMALIEQVQEDYATRFGRVISDTEALRVVEDHARSAGGLGERAS